MKVALWILIFLATFCFMEFMAWFTHKYVMHGFLWSLHKDHHKKTMIPGLSGMMLSLFFTPL